ncbi:MAG: hypothetical protein JWM95_4034 [Gemmatimonadetes bacterium]|nr:hypothetical protein [Gemmatimonadota bacterium]
MPGVPPLREPPATPWRIGPIDVVATDTHALLHDTPSGARLRVTGTRLSRDAHYATAPRDARIRLARAGAMIALRARGRYYLHASAAVDPQGTAWLFAGPSGVGKSTLAYALSRQGWQILGDDGVVLEPVASGATLHAWREPLQVSSALAPEFPELRARQQYENTNDPRRRIPMPTLTARHAPLGAIIFPRRAACDRLSSMTQTMALAELMLQSTQVLLADSETPRHFARLRDVIAAVPSFRLEHTQKQLHAIAHTLRGASL